MISNSEDSCQKKGMNQSEKYKFIFDMYNIELNDREIIQSKLKFFLGLSISSLLSIFLFFDKFKNAYFLESCHLATFLIFVIFVAFFILHAICFYYIYKIFSFKDYQKINDLKENDLNNNLDLFYKGNNEVLVDSFNKNRAINKTRRNGIKTLFILYYIIGGLHFIGLFLYIIWQNFK